MIAQCYLLPPGSLLRLHMLLYELIDLEVDCLELLCKEPILELELVNLLLLLDLGAVEPMRLESVCRVRLVHAHVQKRVLAAVVGAPEDLLFLLELRQVFFFLLDELLQVRERVLVGLMLLVFLSDGVVLIGVIIGVKYDAFLHGGGEGLAHAGHQVVRLLVEGGLRDAGLRHRRFLLKLELYRWWRRGHGLRHILDLDQRLRLGLWGLRANNLGSLSIGGHGIA
jgi:hypothetical protein